ncbi:molybdopterin molybdotransferase MoeA [Aureimonas mangrovi]|uniref:molybdopterin molybdotransferase MoeA n=1 Tax=Aureimonas mangrovi TaxID=2758041 RepID=UPI00163D9257|nr:gephyrin-like molybdotransferase Glp [Aureimonas mangrovi]
MSLLPVEDALERLLRDAIAIGGTEELPLRAAAGRILAETVVAHRTQPDFDASAMDGYAVRAEDVRVGTPLRLIGASAAGNAFERQLGPGEAVRIFTGAPVPPGANAVLIQENTARPDEASVIPTQPITQGSHIRPAGNDFREGGTLVEAGTRLGAGTLALAASGGHPSLTVLRRPRVAVLATGDELVPPGEPVGPAQIVASNTYGIMALAEANGAEVIDLGIAPDRMDALTARIDEAVRQDADILVTIGGASVGDHDLVARALEASGVSLDFWKVAMRPGKPLMAGRRGPMWVLGLPGNPASSMVTATLFLRPLLRRLAGLDDAPGFRKGILATDLPANDHRAEFMRARIESGDGERPTIRPLPRQDSSLLSVYAGATALLLRPANAQAARAGDECSYLPLD